MDPKNKNLTPELKAIYERVMNTPVKPGSAQAEGSTTPPPSASTPGVKPPTASQPVPPQVSPAATKPLPSVAPQPVLGDDKPFVFSADGKKAPVKPIGMIPHDKAKTAPVGKPGGGSKISTPMMVGGGVTFLALYIVIWLKVFNFF